MNNKPLIFAIAITLTSTLSANTPEKIVIAPDASKIINALQYARNENALAAAKVADLAAQTEEALEGLNFFKMIDVLLQTCLYTTERIKHYEDMVAAPEQSSPVQDAITHLEMVLLDESHQAYIKEAEGIDELHTDKTIMGEL